MMTRLLLVVVAAFLGPYAFGQHSPSQKEKVILFVCEHGAARSAIASAYFNKLASEKHLEYVSIFRGVQPDSVLTPGTTKGLSRDGFDIGGWQPHPVDQADLDLASMVVTFDCTLPLLTTKRQERWDGVPPISQDYGVARDQIRLKVEELVKALERKK